MAVYPRGQMINPIDDLNRLRSEYSDRAQRHGNAQKYSSFNITHLFIHQQRERQILRMLKTEGLTSLSDLDILEVGCGQGGVLFDLIKYDAEPGRCTGFDLLHNSLTSARLRLPSSHLYCADGQCTPFQACQFDLILQFTAFSSVLNSQIKTNMAAEMLRVLKPDGAILWYDFWWNPTNPHTAGIKPKEIKALFPDCEFVFRKITLAPPIAKLVVPLSWPLAILLESLNVFNSHYLVLIKKSPRIIKSFQK